MRAAATVFSVIALLGAAIASPVAEPVAAPEAAAEPEPQIGVGGFLFNCRAGYKYDICCPSNVSKTTTSCHNANPFLTGETCPIPQTNTQAIAWCCQTINPKNGRYQKCYRPDVIQI